MAKIVCFIPCCKAKCPSGKIIEPRKVLSPTDLPNTWNLLEPGREGMARAIDRSTPLTTALCLYTGWFYRAISPVQSKILDFVASGEWRLIISSAGYGILDACEPVHDYDAAMAGKIASHWKTSGLAEVIADLILKERPERPYGFFAGKEEWNGAGAKYRYFFSRGAKLALSKGYRPSSAGCFYRKTGLGVAAIMGALGQTFKALVDKGLDNDFCRVVENGWRPDGNIEVGFERLT